MERRIDRAAKAAKGDKKFAGEVELFQRLKEHLDKGQPARSFPCDEEEAQLIAATPLLSNKPVIDRCCWWAAAKSPFTWRFSFSSWACT